MLLVTTRAFDCRIDRHHNEISNPAFETFNQIISTQIFAKYVGVFITSVCLPRMPTVCVRLYFMPTVCIRLYVMPTVCVRLPLMSAIYLRLPSGCRTGGRRSEALVRFGAIGKNELADDDDVIIVIAPQNGP